MSTVVQIKQRSPRWVRDRAITVTESYARATARWRSAPDFLIIGSKRGGTTSLHRYLLMHPGVLGLFPRSRGQKSSDFFFKLPGEPGNRYRAHFHARVYKERLAARLGYLPLSGESSPYYVWDPRIAGQALEVNPDLKAVMLVRDPVERAFSHWQERVQNSVEPLSFGDALDAEEARTAGELERMLDEPTYYSRAHDWYSYRARGEYLAQILNWTAVFPRENLLVVRSEDLYADVQDVFDQVCRFLGVPPVTLPSTRTFNASRRPSMPEAPAGCLRSHYASHNAALEDYLGRPLHWA